jgi:hypothetical protein
VVNYAPTGCSRHRPHCKPPNPKGQPDIARLRGLASLDECVPHFSSPGFPWIEQTGQDERVRPWRWINVLFTHRGPGSPTGSGLGVWDQAVNASFVSFSNSLAHFPRDRAPSPAHRDGDASTPLTLFGRPKSSSSFRPPSTAICSRAGRHRRARRFGPLPLGTTVLAGVKPGLAMGDRRGSFGA